MYREIGAEVTERNKLASNVAVDMGDDARTKCFRSDGSALSSKGSIYEFSPSSWAQG